MTWKKIIKAPPNAGLMDSWGPYRVYEKDNKTLQGWWNITEQEFRLAEELADKYEDLGWIVTGPLETTDPLNPEKGKVIFVEIKHAF